MTKARDISSLIGSSGQIDNAKITLDANEIPALDTAKITTGTLSADRIDNNSLSNVTALPFSAGTDWQSTIVTGSTLSAVAGKGYWIDTTSNACTVTLPSSASVGDQIILVDYDRTWNTNNLTIDLNGLNYQGGTENPVYDTNGQTVNIVYSGATNGWVPISDDDVAVEGFIPPYSVDFLVIAGGGSGGVTGNMGGGGGAGGYRNSYNSETSGGGFSSETALGFTVGTVYTITVGAGGAGGGGSNTYSGNDSSISGSNITTITSIGGGTGLASKATGESYDGGSGGGGSGLPATGGNGTANQGYNGGNGGGAGYGAGGGGGAGAVGGNASSSGSGSSGGNGGSGLASSITGSSVTRAGGGGGSSYDATQGSGGSGGGGTAAFSSASSGTANTGSGGGGAQSNSGNGGSGVVILRMATANYTGTTSGSPTVSTAGSDTVLVFNSSGSYTG